VVRLAAREGQDETFESLRARLHLKWPFIAIDRHDGDRFVVLAVI
jgi:hypothetical protein